MDPEIARVAESLRHNQQRATYSAVAAILGRNPRDFMEGEERNHQNSWIVSATSGLPTDYEQQQLDPALLTVREQGAPVIDDGRELQAWLDRHLLDNG